MRCSARRRRAADIISIARVIFWMFLTDPMRFWTSRWLTAWPSFVPRARGGVQEQVDQGRRAQRVPVAQASPRTQTPRRSCASSARAGGEGWSRGGGLRFALLGLLLLGGLLG